jgi:nucleoid-associated protein YgaU
VTRELKLALIIAVTLILSVMVLISDHLSVQRRPIVASEVSVQPDRVPPPPVVETPPAPVASTMGDALAGTPAEPSADQPAGSTTVAMGDRDEHAELAKAIERVGGTVKDGEIVLPEKAAPSKPSVVELTQETPASPATKTATAVKPTPSAAKGRTHVVAPGDSAFKLARQYLGDGKYWKQIKEANPKAFANDAELKVGTEIVIPEVRPAAPKSVPATPATKASPTRLAQAPTATSKELAIKGREPSKNKQYTIRKGDTLHTIAKRELGSSGRVDEIMRMNRGVIKDPTTLPLGVAIVLPSDR